MNETINKSNTKVKTLNRRKNKDYVLLIPVVNEGNRLTKQLETTRLYANIVDIVVIDGNSNDGSTSLDSLKKNKVKVRILNTGDSRLGSQLKIGISYALSKSYKGVLLMDGNGKDDPTAIPVFVEKLDVGCDFVQGSRFIKGGKHVNTPLLRYFSIKFIHSPICTMSSGFKFSDSANGFKAFSRRFLMDKRVQPLRETFNTYNLQCYLTIRAPQLGFKTVEIPVTRSYPKSGKTPTKIVGFNSHLMFLLDLIQSAVGIYNINKVIK